MTEILVEKKLGGLSAASSEAYAVLSKIPNGTKLVVDVKSPNVRSVQRHRYWFSLLNLAYENSEALQHHFGKLDNFRQVLLIRLGYCNTYRTNDGPVPVARSVSFAKMSESEFGVLVDDTLRFFETELGMDRDQMEAEVRA